LTMLATVNGRFIVLIGHVCLQHDAVNGFICDS